MACVPFRGRRHAASLAARSSGRTQACVEDFVSCSSSRATTTLCTVAPVTAVAVDGSHVLAGVGSFVRRYEAATGALRESVKVFEDEAVHGLLILSAPRQTSARARHVPSAESAAAAVLSVDGTRGAEDRVGDGGGEILVLAFGVRRLCMIRFGSGASAALPAVNTLTALFCRHWRVIGGSSGGSSGGHRGVIGGASGGHRGVIYRCSAARPLVNPHKLFPCFRPWCQHSPVGHTFRFATLSPISFAHRCHPLLFLPR